MEEREAVAVATLFADYDLIECVAEDGAYTSQNPDPGNNIFQPSKRFIYQLTQRGKDLINGSITRRWSSEREGSTGSQRNGIAKDSNTQRLDKILNDPSVRLLFREQSRDTYCEENLSFYQDVDEFIRNCKVATRAVQKEPNMTATDGISESIAQAYRIYNAFLAVGSPCELNIDHQLRNSLTTRMTKGDSVPKFLSNPKYEQQLRSYEFDLVGNGPEQG
ncbi:hypothetical protein FALCPG4_018290 [Fusarium falciforme]